jgi:hypothetical protein
LAVVVVVAVMAVVAAMTFTGKAKQQSPQGLSLAWKASCEGVFHCVRVAGWKHVDALVEVGGYCSSPMTGVTFVEVGMGVGSYGCDREVVLNEVGKGVEG